MGSATTPTRERMADVAVDNLLAALAGQQIPFLDRLMSAADRARRHWDQLNGLLVCRIQGNRSRTRRSTVTQVAPGANADGRLDEEAMERVFATLDEYRSASPVPPLASRWA